MEDFFTLVIPLSVLSAAPFPVVLGYSDFSTFQWKCEKGDDGETLAYEVARLKVEVMGQRGGR